MMPPSATLNTACRTTYISLRPARCSLPGQLFMLDSTEEGVLQGLVTNYNGNQILVRFDIVVVPGMRRNLFSVMTAVKKAL